MPYDKTRVILRPYVSGGSTGKDESSSAGGASSSGGIRARIQKTIVTGLNTFFPGKDSATAQGDYINANYVKMLIGDEELEEQANSSGYYRRWIASQGPLENTKNDFWKMIYDRFNFESVFWFYH